MKKISIHALMLALSFITFISCGEDAPNPKPKPEPNPTENTHFDVWSPIDGIAGMGGKNYLVKRTASLEKGEISFEGSGVDLSNKLYPQTIIKGKYYYQITKEGRFGKYQISENQLVTIKEFPFPTLKPYRYSHAWLDNKTLLLMGANGESSKILWVKVNAETMEVISEGEMAFEAPKKVETINSSGMAAYRKADNKILYSYEYKNDKSPRKKFYMAFINPADMSIVKTVEEARAEFMASTAYGELRQDKSFFDENGDYYLACNSVLPGEGPSPTSTTAQKGALLRVKKGAMDFDKSYNGYNRERGKIVAVTYLNNGKALLYMQDPRYATPDDQRWDSKNNPYVFYWLIVDLKTGSITDLKDKNIPFGVGNFAQLALVVGKKAYFGVNPKEGNSAVYIYDISSGEITQGMTVAKGFSIERLIQVEN